jgi:hypothetical protein
MGNNKNIDESISAIHRQLEQLYMNRGVECCIMLFDPYTETSHQIVTARKQTLRNFKNNIQKKLKP